MIDVALYTVWSLAVYPRGIVPSDSPTRCSDAGDMMYSMTWRHVHISQPREVVCIIMATFVCITANLIL
jgi:hypothetical protein